MLDAPALFLPRPLMVMSGFCFSAHNHPKLALLHCKLRTKFLNANPSLKADPDKLIAGSAVTLTVTAHDPQSLPLTTTYDFGDGIARPGLVLNDAP